MRYGAKRKQNNMRENRIISSVLILHCASNVASKYSAPILFYDEDRFRYEDSLIRGTSDLREAQPRDLRDDDHDPMIRVQPLNFRLPSLLFRPPSFATPPDLVMAAVTGSTVVLPCRVKNLGPASVSWLRGRPHLTVLTSGSFMFSTSQRLSLLHDEGSPDFNLQISEVTHEDAGEYRCQLNTRPTQSVLVTLVTREPSDDLVPALALRADLARSREVTRARTEILAPDLVKMTEAGTVTLECVVTEHDSPPSHFVW